MVILKLNHIILINSRPLHLSNRTIHIPSILSLPKVRCDLIFISIIKWRVRQLLLLEHVNLIISLYLWLKMIHFTFHYNRGLILSNIHLSFPFGSHIFYLLLNGGLIVLIYLLVLNWLSIWTKRNNLWRCVRVLSNFVHFLLVSRRNHRFFYVF